MQEPYTLAKDAVHLWSAALDAEQFPPNQLRPCLSADEQQRAARFATAELRHRFIIARALLRHLLGAYVQQAPASLTFSYAEKGKPFLKSAPALCFNMSHTESQVIYAVARQAVGVDIEQMRASLKHEELTRLVLSEQEKRAWQWSPQAQRRLVFFRTWTRKEALLKACGKGLAGNMRQICLPLSPQVLALHDYFMPMAAHSWALYDLPQQGQTLGCLVVQQPIQTLIMRDCSHLSVLGGAN